VVDWTLTLIILFSIYAASIGIFGLWDSGRNTPTRDPRNRFAVVIPAHNEETVIEPLLQNLREQKYPRDLFDIYVVADNCDDDTAALARRAGAHVLERFSEDKRGKGHAIRYALKHLGFIGENVSTIYDAVVLFDADNLVDPKFLGVMNDRLLAGEHLVQAFLDSKNPTDTWISSAYSLLFWLNCRYMMLARYNLGLSAAFMGTGMCISARALADVGWNVETLTEDLEYSSMAVLHGYRTHYAHETRVYDEKPLTFIASVRQRLRWARGQFAVAFKYMIPLIRSGLKRYSPVQVEAGLRLAQLFVLLSASPVFLLYSYLGAGETWGIAGSLLEAIPYFPDALIILPYTVMAVAAIVDNHPVESYFYAPLYPVFTFSWLLILVVGLMTMQNDSWMPTEHNRALDLDEVKQPEILDIEPRDAIAQHEARIAMAGGFSGTNWH
ncbi:MAG: glycosyltransferase family 2 protein, partial [Clostridia bacterium]